MANDEHDLHNSIKAPAPVRKKSASATTTICIDGFQYTIGEWTLSLSLPCLAVYSLGPHDVSNTLRCALSVIT